MQICCAQTRHKTLYFHYNLADYKFQVKQSNFKKSGKQPSEVDTKNSLLKVMKYYFRKKL